jgi:putative DNA methylase
LSTHKGNEAFVEPIYEGKESRKFRFEIRRSGQPKEGTVSRAGAICLACSNPISFDHIRSEGVAGRVGHQMMAMVADGSRSRVYLAPTAEQEAAADVEAPASAPESALPGSALGFRVQKYGLTRHRDLFTNRQLVALSCLADAISAVRDEVLAASGGDKGYADLIQAFLALSLSRVAQTNNTLVRWLVRTSGTSKGTPAFDRQIVSMVWEFSEGNILGNSVGSWNAAIKNPLTALKCLPEGGDTGKAVQANASENDLGITDAVISTDPPYFDAIGYADLSDFFYIWLRRAVGEVHKDLFGTLLAPKEEDLSAALGRNDVSRQLATKQFLERLSAAFKKIHDASSESIPVTIYYAFKQAESGDDAGDTKGKSQSSGWSTLLESVIQAGFQITGTWPLRTESVSRLRAIGSNALATSILLVCRKKVEAAGVISRAEFLRALKRELPSALAELQAANIAPADMPQSAIGPGMGVFSRYQRVLESDDSQMSVKTALQLINRELDEYLGGIQGEFDADTRFAITWFEQNGLKAGDYGTANSIATARGISVDSVKHAGIVESAAGKVRILARDELDDDWDPEEDRHLTVWECLQHLVRQHEKEGISNDTAVLLKKINTQAEAVKDLAYCLYDISANKRKDAKEATAYNALIADWTELTKAAAAIHDTSGDRQIRLDI